jgi:hypothetical protein
VAMMDAAQYGMLVTMWADLEEQQTPTPQFLHLFASCRLQQESDRNHGIHRSRHLLNNIRQSTGAALMVGASVVTYNPHHVHYSSPFPIDSHLGAVPEWPPVPGQLMLDSFEPSLRATLLQKAAAHA